MLRRYKGRRRAKPNAYLQAGKVAALVTVATFTVATSTLSYASVSDPNNSDPNSLTHAALATSDGLPASLLRNAGPFTSRSQHRVVLSHQNMVEVTSAASVQDGFDGPDQWQRRQDLLAARAIAKAEAARLAQAEAAVQATRARAAAKAARAAKDARKARAVAAQVQAAEAAVGAERARAALFIRTGSGPSGAAVARAKAWAAAELTRMGYEPEQFTCLDQLWTRESGWNPLADNPTSTAYGIPQSLPGSKMASAGADWLTNPKTQITWGLRYIKTRYENPCGAWAHSESDNWY